MTIWTEHNVRELISTNEKALIKALLAIWNYQTNSEQAIGDAIEDNGVGFNKPDSFTAKKYIRIINRGEKLRAYELDKLRRVMYKYVKQLVKIANLNEMLKVDNGQSARKG